MSEQEYSELEKENWARGKDQKPTEVELDRSQIEKFVKFVAEARASGDFEIHLGLNRRDIEGLKRKLGIDTADDARKFLADVFAMADEEREAFYASEQRKAQQTREAAEKRLSDYEKSQSDEREERRARLASVLNSTEIKEEDAQRQRRFADSKQGEYDVPESDWRLPADSSPEQFQHIIETRGWSFATTMFGVEKASLIAESTRLGLSIDFDMVPR